MDPNVPDFVAKIPVFRGGELPKFFPLPDFANPIEMDLKCQIPKKNDLIKSHHGQHAQKCFKFARHGKYARKCFQFAPLSRPKALDNDKKKFKQELDILYHAQHHHIIELVYAYIFEPVEDEDDEDEPRANPHAAIIMVLAQSFRSILRGPSVQRDERMRSNFFKWFTCLAIALDHIHGVGIRHRDIKPDNILVVKDDEVVLADFGISNMILGKTLSTTSQGAARDRTAMYCAPEVEGGSSRTRSADVFALGVTFLEMLAQLRPGGKSALQDAFEGEDQNQGPSYTAALSRLHDMMETWREDPKGKLWKDRKREWAKLLSMCQNMMNEDPYKRPCALDITSQISRIEMPEPMQPCKCSKPPDEPGARLFYICKNGLTSDLRLLKPLKRLNNTVGAVHQASARGHLEIVTTLLHVDNGFDVNLRDYSGQTALHCAAAFGKHEVVKYLLDRPDVNPTIKDDKGRTALHCAAGNGHLEVVQMLRQGRLKLNANVGDEHQRTALHFAATRGHKKVIDELLTSNAIADVNEGDYNGVTALHLAAGYGSVQAVTSLLKNGAKADISEKTGRDSKERSALRFAIDGIQKLDENEDRGQYEEVIRLLLPKAGIKVCTRVACDSPTKTCNHHSRRNMVCNYVANQPS